MTDGLRGFRQFVTGFEARQSSVVTSVKSLIPHPSSLIPKEINRWLISLLLGGEQGPQQQEWRES